MVRRHIQLHIASTMPPKKGYNKRKRDQVVEEEETEVIPETQQQKDPEDEEEETDDEECLSNLLLQNVEADIDPEEDSQQPATTAKRKRGKKAVGASEVTVQDKRRKKVCNFSDQEEDELVDWVRDHPILYVRTMKEYKDSGKNKLLWEGKAKQLGVDLTVLLTWYKSLRTRLGKLTFKKSGEGSAEKTDRDKWILDRFDFLKKHIHRVRGRVGASVSTHFQVHYYYAYTFLKVLLIFYLLQGTMYDNLCKCKYIFSCSLLLHLYFLKGTVDF